MPDLRWNEAYGTVGPPSVEFIRQTLSRTERNKVKRLNTEEQAHQKTFNIVVNTKDKTWTGKEIGYMDVIRLAYEPKEPPSGPDWEFTVMFRQKSGGKPEGSIAEGGTEHVKEGMIFTVKATNKS